MASGKQAFGLVVGAALAIYAFVYVAVPALTELFTADTADWDSGAAGLLSVIAIFLILGVAVIFAKPAMDKL